MGSKHIKAVHIAKNIVALKKYKVFKPTTEIYVMKRICLIAFIAIFNLAGCTTLTEQGAKVSISHTVWQGCRFVASIKGAETDSNSDLALRNKAGSIGANLVVVTGYANHGLLYGEIPSKGDAYECVTQAQIKEKEEKLRLEQEKKLAEEKARLEAERIAAEEKAKADEIARIEAEKLKIEEEKQLLAEEKARLEKLKAEAEEILAAKEKSLKVGNEAKAVLEEAPVDRAPTDVTIEQNINSSPKADSEVQKRADGESEKKTKMADTLLSETGKKEKQISKENQPKTIVQ